jgi:hypothetical protein
MAPILGTPLRGTETELCERVPPTRRIVVMRFYVLTTLAIGSFALIACASTPGAQPQDMSAAHHEQMAASQETAASQHASQYDPNAQTKTVTCGGKAGCWTSTTNPTKEHLAEADKLRKMAADHRTASQALRDAEARSCAGLSDEDRDTSPFSHRDDIASVQPAYASRGGGKLTPANELIGAVVTFRALPGLTAEWLQRVVECHIARNNAMGNDMPEMTFCPLEPKGVNATVSSSGDGFAVRIESQDAKTAQEVLRRAQALKNPG